MVSPMSTDPTAGAEPLWTRVEDLLGEDRQHRHGSAEKHREEIQADGPQQQPLGENKAQALAQAGEDGADPGLRGPGRVADEE